jgi:hypothetical protein
MLYSWVIETVLHMCSIIQHYSRRAIAPKADERHTQPRIKTNQQSREVARCAVVLLTSLKAIRYCPRSVQPNRGCGCL